MPQAPIPFVNDQKSGFDEIGGASPLAVNVVIDGLGTVRRRPGIASYVAIGAGAPTGVGGLWASLEDKLYVVGTEVPARNIYRVGMPGTGATSVNLSVGASGLIESKRQLAGTGRPVFAETEAMVVIAGGAEPEKILFKQGFDVDIPSRLGGSPPRASHVVAMAQRLVANDTVTDNKSRFFYSALAAGSSFAGHETWNGALGLDGSNSGDVDAQARSDKVVALGESTSEVFVFGATTTEIYGTDPAFVFQRTQVKEVGCGAPYSIVKVDQGQYWLDHLRRFVSSDGRKFTVLSGAIQQTLDQMAMVSDCFGYRVRVGPADGIVWTFPEDGRSFYYQFGGGWSQWMGWNTASDRHARFRVNAQAIRFATGDTIVGLTDGQIGILKLDHPTDIGDPIVSEVVTGFQNRGTNLRKHCTSVMMAFRRGTVEGATPVVGHLYFRDLPGAKWDGPLTVDLGASADREPVVFFRSLGVYRMRQWRFVFGGTTDLVLANAFEEYEVLAA